jgi:hypothetical protein
MANSNGRRASTLCFIVSFTLMAGCAQTSPWTAPARTPTVLEPVARIHTPEGWVQEHNAYRQLVASRDGYLVQLIYVSARTNFDAFPDINKDADPSMLPSQLAELNIANLKAGSDEKIEVLENEPAEVGDLAGYRLQLRFFDELGLEFRALVYGAGDEHYFYRITYQAPVLYFFDRDLPAFEAMVKTFQRGSPPRGEPGWAIVSLDAIGAQKK